MDRPLNWSTAGKHVFSRYSKVGVYTCRDGGRDPRMYSKEGRQELFRGARGCHHRLLGHVAPLPGGP